MEVAQKFGLIAGDYLFPKQLPDVLVAVEEMVSYF